MALLVLFNNFFHDLSVGILFANVLLTLILLRLLKKHQIGGDQFLNEFVRLSSRITWAALVFIILGGIVRTATYKSFEWAEAAGKGQVTALILKHFLLIGCTATGIYLQVRLSRRHSGKNCEAVANKEKQYA
jgi:hypothetical protein